MKLQVRNRLPQWIISSDKAAYHPASNTIWLRRDREWLIFHELLHVLACRLGKYGNWIHRLLDRGRVSPR